MYNAGSSEKSAIGGLPNRKFHTVYVGPELAFRYTWQDRNVLRWILIGVVSIYGEIFLNCGFERKFSDFFVFFLIPQHLLYLYLLTLLFAFNSMLRCQTILYSASVV